MDRTCGAKLRRIDETPVGVERARKTARAELRDLKGRKILTAAYASPVFTTGGRQCVNPESCPGPAQCQGSVSMSNCQLASSARQQELPSSSQSKEWFFILLLVCTRIAASHTVDIPAEVHGLRVADPMWMRSRRIWRSSGVRCRRRTSNRSL